VLEGSDAVARDDGAAAVNLAPELMVQPGHRLASEDLLVEHAQYRALESVARESALSAASVARKVPAQT
jgi:hypothetical protein